MNLLANILALCGAYVVGSLPVGFWIAQWAGIQDIRRYGSGNIGATNVARLLGLHFFFTVFALDALKAFLYLRLCQEWALSPFMVMLCAYALLIGNAYSFLLNGSGGKGMATFVGIMLALNPWLCVALMVTWIVALMHVRVAGIASVITACVIPCYALFFTSFYGFLFLLSIAFWIVYRHKDNVRVYYTGRW